MDDKLKELEERIRSRGAASPLTEDMLAIVDEIRSLRTETHIARRSQTATGALARAALRAIYGIDIATTLESVVTAALCDVRDLDDVGAVLAAVNRRIAEAIGRHSRQS